MRNTNCLEGKSCPECGQTDRIRVVAMTFATVIDNGIEETYDAEYDDYSPATCPSCEFTGTWGDFDTDRCANCGEQIVPDPDDEWHHRADDVAGCGTEDAEGHELYATPINTKEN